MGSGLRRWVVLFFSRPVRFSDLASLLGLFKRKAVASNPEPVAVLPSTAKPRSSKIDMGDIWRPESVATPEVSEQPLDSLPAELQDELKPRAGPKP
jgi:hypothetical protein